MNTRIPVAIDTDPGVDDVVAIWSLLGDDRVDVVGLTTVFGNAELATTTANARRLLATVSRNDIPVNAGVSHPLMSATVHGAPAVHGVDGLGGITPPNLPIEPGDSPESASNRLIELSHLYEGSLRVVALGPLTNIAITVLRDPGFVSRLHSLSIMGGAVFRSGNVTEFAEANIWNDPEAAQIVFSSGAPITLAPLDVTETQRFLREDQLALRSRSGSPCADLADMLELYFDFYHRVVGTMDIPLHDPLAALLATGAVRALTTRRGGIDVALHGIERGRTVWRDDPDGVVSLPLSLDHDTRTVVLRLLAALDTALGKATA